MSRKKVLIASSSFDEHTHGPVRTELERRGHEVRVYCTDRVMRGADAFELLIHGDGSPRLRLNGTSIEPGDVDAAWYWKVANFAIPDADRQLAKQLTMVNEIAQVNNSVWSLYPDRLWLSAPRAIHWAERKLPQLLLASRLGFEVPRTMMSSTWPALEDEYETPDMVVKMFRGVTAEGNTVRAMYTTRVTDAVLRQLRGKAQPFPGLYQNYIEKRREWRVTVVGDAVFAGAIYTDDSASDDWRRLQSTAAVAMRAERLDPAISDLCRAYLRETRLGIGSFDLVERPDGSVVFLECNPNGQFGFLAEALDMPIYAAIAEELLAVAGADEALPGP